MNLKRSTSNSFSLLFALAIVTSSLFSLQTANAQNGPFWTIKVANYLNATEAAQELTRFKQLDFEGQISSVTENGTDFHQLQIGCFLNKHTATLHLTALTTHLRYPSLSGITEQTNTSISPCIGYETGIHLPKVWQMIETDKVFLISVTLAGYEHLIGFNGSTWESFQNEAAISQAWLNTAPNSVLLNCASIESAFIECKFEGSSLKTYQQGDILWQNGMTTLYKHENFINLIRYLQYQ